MQIVSLADKKEFIWELAELHHGEWKHFNPLLSLEKRAELIDKAAGQEGIPSVFIATSGSRLIGSAAVVRQDMDTKPELSPWLAAVYVKEDYRHQGIAAKLIARCEQEVAHSGIKTWYLYTEFASKLYERLGWCLMERCVYKGVVVSVMSKAISQP